MKTIDVHAHCGVPAAMALMGLKLPTEALLMSSPAARMRAMDAQGIDVEALSINPYWYEADREQPREGDTESRTRSWRSLNLPTRRASASRRWLRWRCSIPTWRRSSLKTVGGKNG